MGNKVIKSVSFNPVTNEKDAAILKALKRRKNFSGYVKKLIANDLFNKDEEQKKQEPKEEKEKPRELSAAEKLAKLKKSGQPAQPKPNIFKPKN